MFQICRFSDDHNGVWAMPTNLWGDTKGRSTFTSNLSKLRAKSRIETAKHVPSSTKPMPSQNSITIGMHGNPTNRRNKYVKNSNSPTRLRIVTQQSINSTKSSPPRHAAPPASLMNHHLSRIGTPNLCQLLGKQLRLENPLNPLCGYSSVWDWRSPF